MNMVYQCGCIFFRSENYWRKSGYLKPFGDIFKLLRGKMWRNVISAKK